MRRKSILCVPSRGPSLTPSLAGISEITARILAASLGSQLSFCPCLFPIAGAQRPTVEDPFLSRFGLLLWCIDYSSVSHQIAQDSNSWSSGHVLSKSYEKETILPV